MHGLYRPKELAFRTQYAEVKERANAAGFLLPGTPGTLVKREGTGYPFWYRVYQSAPGHQVEDLICKDGDQVALDKIRSELDFSQWMATQLRHLRKLEFQAADKGVSRVLVELHNKGILADGLMLVGTLCYMTWLNELGVTSVVARTQDIDLAVRQKLKLAVPHSILLAMQATKLGFSPVPGMPSQAPSTSLKLQGRDGLRVDLLTNGIELGAVVAVPELMWHAQTVPHYDYLLDQPVKAAVLAGGHCVPVSVPQAERLVWHKLYSSASRKSFPEKAAKDLLQAATLAAVLTEQHDENLSESLSDAPAALQATVRRQLGSLRRMLAAHPQTLAQFETALRA